MARRRKPGDGAGKPAPSSLSLAEQLVAAREAGLRLLSVRERSAAEMRARLRQKGFDPEVIVTVLAALEETGLQDDGRFAAQFAETAAGRGLASRRIQAELRARGIAKDLAADASTEHPDEELARARELAGRRAARMGDLPPEARARRIMGLLARRGYDPETCRTVAAEVARLEPTTESLDPSVRLDLP
ncbi:MAG: regulatory protein RecX [Actinomycetota bacterium]